MSEPVLLIDRAEGVAVLTLNRPHARNALSSELRAALVSALSGIAADDDVAAVILTGAGKAFCAGLDLKELSEKGLGAGGTGEDPAQVDVVGAMHRFDKPIIGAVNGVAVTGGFEVALACDFLVASVDARFADTHARVGIVPGWGLSQRLPRLIGIGRAKEMSLTGNYIDAAQAAAWGLVNRVVEADALLPTCRALAADMASCVPEALREIKSTIDAGYAATFDEGMRYERKRSIAWAKTITPEMIAKRRAGVQARGKNQTE